MLTVLCALGALASVAHADDRDQFRQRVYERTHQNAEAHRDRNYDRRDGHREYFQDRNRRDYGRHDYDRRDYDRRDYDRHRDFDRHYYDRGYDRHYDRSYYRHYDRGYDHRSYRSYPRATYYDRFDRRLVPSLQRGFYCDDFHHFRGPHYHVSRADFYGSFYPLYPYRPYYDRGGSLSVIVSIPF